MASSLAGVWPTAWAVLRRALPQEFKAARAIFDRSSDGGGYVVVTAAGKVSAFAAEGGHQPSHLSSLASMVGRTTLQGGTMGIFQRAHDIVQAKTNKALDAAEKPDEMLDLSYEKMLEQITQVRRALVDLAASKKRLELQEEQFTHTIDHLQDQAKQALQANREDLAKEALARKAAAQQQIDEMEPQRQQLEEEEKKLTTTLDALQKRVNDFRTQKETLKAQYTAAKAISTVDESAAGISKSFNDSGASLQRAQDKIATMQARSGALDELLESGVLEDVGGGTDDIQKELDQVGTDAQVDNELAALKAQLGTGAPPEPDALAPAAESEGAAPAS